MLREVVEALEALAEERPVVLVLDDLHWSDHATLDLVETLALRDEPALLVLGTYSDADARAASTMCAEADQRLRIRGRCAGDWRSAPLAVTQCGRT